MDDDKSVLLAEVGEGALVERELGLIERDERLAGEASHDVVMDGGGVQHGGGADALRAFPAVHRVLGAGEHPILEDVAHREHVGNAVQSAVIIHPDVAFPVEGVFHHRMTHRVLERGRVRLRARARVHLARGEHVALVCGVRAQHVVEFHNLLVDVHLHAQ